MTVRFGILAGTAAWAATVAASVGISAAEFRSKPGAPRAPAPVVGAEVGVAPPSNPIDASIGASVAGAPAPEDLRATSGAADYGFDPARDADIAEAPPLDGAPRPLWPNK